MKTYPHVQKAGITLAIPAVLASLLVAVAPVFRFPGALGGVVVLAAVSRMFHSMTIETGDGELRWHFGNGWFRQRVPLAEIRSVALVRTTWLDGWGVHHTAHGWLHNVSGNEALAIRLAGGRRIALGTDDAVGLASALATVRA
jgi:hypothetical protein